MRGCPACRPLPSVLSTRFQLLELPSPGTAPPTHQPLITHLFRFSEPLPGAEEAAVNRTPRPLPCGLCFWGTQSPCPALCPLGAQRVGKGRSRPHHGAWGQVCRGDRSFGDSINFFFALQVNSAAYFFFQQERTVQRAYIIGVVVFSYFPILGGFLGLEGFQNLLSDRELGIYRTFLINILGRILQ